MKKILCNLIITLAIIMMIISVIYIGYIALQWKKNNEISNLLDEVEILGAGEAENERIQQVQGLKEINQDIIGWLEIEGTNINYPVLQSEDNEYYLNHDYKGAEDVNGSIFLDYATKLGETSNYMIYGHNNKNGIMFDQLEKFKDYEFYSKHKTIRFTTEDSDDEYEIIAVLMTDAQNDFTSNNHDIEDNDFKYYSFNNINNETDFNLFVENCKQHSLYEIEKTAKFGEQLITLSTCEYSTKDGRLGIVAKKLKSDRVFFCVKNDRVFFLQFV